jgi:hypothetical protein
MIHTKCKSCGNSLAFIEFEYRTEIFKICNDNKLNEEDKKNKISNLIKSYSLPLCCNTKLLTSVNMAEIIIQNQE